MASIRTDIAFKLVCSKCGETLECDADTPDRNKIAFGSAYKAEAHLAIKPCERCTEEAAEPLKLMRKALGLH